MSTSSLREEIRETFDHYWDDEYDEATDEILKLFEKRIDESIAWSDKVPKKMVDRAIKNKELDGNHYYWFKDGYQFALELLKKEMLKK